MAEEKEKLSLKEIEKELDKKKEDKEKIEYLKEFLKDEKYKDMNRSFTKLIVPLLTKQKPNGDYRLTYDSINESLEPIYFWILDFMRDSPPGGLGLDVKKGPESFEASVTSGYFGEMGQRSSLMQQKSIEYIGAINQIIKSIINLIYDLKEFEIRIEAYDHAKSEDPKIKSGGVKSLKGIWMDQVDARKGRGSINLLAQDLQFITLRDAFFHFNTIKELKDADLNERVINILERKLEEYETWVKKSEEEIRKRYNLERIYLKSQVGSLKLYANWVKPYLIASQKLKTKGSEPKDFKNPNIVNSFSNMEMEIRLYGKREVKPDAVHESLKDVKLDRKYFAVIEIITDFRSVPSALSGQGGRHYVHGGRTDIAFKGFVFDDIEMQALDNYELYEDIDLIEDYIGNSLKLLQDEISAYLDPPKNEEDTKKEIKKKPVPGAFDGIFSGFTGIFKPAISFTTGKKKISSVVYNDVRKAAEDSAGKMTFTIYNVYKKTHGMMNV
ncbi:hypothetical protein J4440_01285 [Candidatus Woesearchaeota archaeon]|nr:hypothetical protein [Candidatus Woesearchaeota archaeon]